MFGKGTRFFHFCKIVYRKNDFSCNLFVISCPKFIIVKKILLVFVISSSFLQIISAQISFPDARTSAGVSRNDVFSPWENCASLSYIEKFEVSANYQNRFGVKEFSTAGAQMAIGTKAINIGASFVQYGFLDYHEQLYAVSLARKIGKRFALSVQADYYAVHYSSLSGSDGKFIVQVGMMVEPINHLYIGFQAFNPVQTKIETDGLKKEIPSVFALGLSYWFTPKVVTSIQCEKDIFRDFDFSAEVAYNIYDAFGVKVACLKEGVIMPSAGCKFSIKGVSLDANFKVHSKLGVIPEMALTYTLK